MKRLIAFVLAITLAAGSLAGCGGSGSGSTTAGTTKAGETTAAAAAATTAAAATAAAEKAATTAAAKGETTAANGKKKKIALVCDVAGTQVFVLSMIDGLNAAAEKYGFEKTVAECADSAAYEDSIRALVEENYDLIIVGGWMGGDALNAIAQEFPDKCDYALVDSTVDAKNVKCISYREQEGAYLIGMIAASVIGEGQHMYGAVHVNQGPGSWKWRYGYQEGVKSIDPAATFTFNYTGNYNDPAKAKEYALQQYAAGARFINAAAAGGDVGVFEAALENKFCTSGQDVDLTNPSNPYIVSSQIKDTKATLEYICEKYMTNNWTPDSEEWGIAEGTIGAVYITQDSKNPRSDKLTDAAVTKIKAAAEDIRTGKLNLKNMPTEENYK